LLHIWFSVSADQMGGSRDAIHFLLSASSHSSAAEWIC
jgi:hypothetical protein